MRISKISSFVEGEDLDNGQDLISLLEVREVGGEDLLSIEYIFQIKRDSGRKVKVEHKFKQNRYNQIYKDMMFMKEHYILETVESSCGNYLHPTMSKFLKFMWKGKNYVVKVIEFQWVDEWKWKIIYRIGSKHKIKI